MREWWWRFRYAVRMWWIVPWMKGSDAWDAAWAMEWDDVKDYTPSESVDEELSYWTE